MFSDVAVYNRVVMTPESLPYVVDKAIREAYKNSSVSVIIMPNNFGYVENSRCRLCFTYSRKKLATSTGDRY